MENDSKTGVAAFCPGCHGIVYAATDNVKHEVKSISTVLDSYLNQGFKIGRVSQQDVAQNFGCKCHTEEKEAKKKKEPIPWEDLDNVLHTWLSTIQRLQIEKQKLVSKKSGLSAYASVVSTQLDQRIRAYKNCVDSIRELLNRK